MNKYKSFKNFVSFNTYRLFTLLTFCVTYICTKINASAMKWLRMKLGKGNRKRFKCTCYALAISHIKSNKCRIWRISMFCFLYLCLFCVSLCVCLFVCFACVFILFSFFTRSRISHRKLSRYPDQIIQLVRAEDRITTTRLTDKLCWTKGSRIPKLTPIISHVGNCSYSYHPFVIYIKVFHP